MKMRVLLGMALVAGGMALGSLSCAAADPLDSESLMALIPGQWETYSINWQGISPKIMRLSRPYPTPVGPLINPISGQGSSNALYTATQFLYTCAPYMTHARLDLAQSLVLSELLLSIEKYYPERGTGYHVQFKQEYGGYPVYEGRCHVNLNNHYEIWGVQNELREITVPPQTPKLSEAEAFARVLARYSWVTTNDFSPGSLFYYSPSNLVWAFHIPTYGSLAKIDVVTGVVVGEDPNAIPTPGYRVAGIALNNYDVNHPVYYLETNRLAGKDCYVEILGGPDPEHLQPVAPGYPGWSAVSALGPDGSFDRGAGIVPGVEPNASAWFQVLAWKGEGTTKGWAKATERAASDVFQWFTGTICINLGAMCEVWTFNFPSNLVIRPVVPTLAMSRAGYQLIFSWPYSEGLSLESTDRLATNWVRVAELPATVGNESVWFTPVAGAARYYRLRK